jgi:hypothetical protein
MYSEQQLLRLEWHAQGQRQFFHSCSCWALQTQHAAAVPGLAPAAAAAAAVQAAAGAAAAPAVQL